MTTPKRRRRHAPVAGPYSSLAGDVTKGLGVALVVLVALFFLVLAVDGARPSAREVKREAVNWALEGR